MTKEELKEKLIARENLSSLFKFIDGQDCLIYKNKFEASNEIIYIPDICLNEIETESPLNDTEIDHVIHNCYTGNDFISECSGHENLAKELFEFVDWQHPNIQDLLDTYDEDEFKEKYGFSEEL